MKSRAPLALLALVWTVLNVPDLLLAFLEKWRPAKGA